MMYSKLIDFIGDLPDVEKTKVLAQIVQSGQKYIGLNLPRLTELIAVRLRGEPGTEQQCRKARREMKHCRFLAPGSSRTLAMWCVCTDPSWCDVPHLITWYQNLWCDNNAHLSRCDAIALALNTIASFVALIAVYPTTDKMEA